MHDMRSLRSWIKHGLFVPSKKLTARREISRYLARTPAPRLNIGAGGNRVRGWLNLDLSPSPGVSFMDASRKWPFGDASIDAILCEHMIEHVSKSLGTHLLREARRTLKPGGWLRVVSPDLDWLARRILEPATPSDERYLQFINGFFDRRATSWCDAINLCFYEHGHRYIWSIDELRSELKRAGFSELTVTRAAFPTHPVFRGAEGHPRLIGAENDAIEAFAIEAMAPIYRASNRARNGSVSVPA